MTNLWIAGRNCLDKAWEILGIYSSEKMAVDRCRIWEDFVAPLELDKDQPEEAQTMPGCYYPMAEREKKGE